MTNCSSSSTSAAIPIPDPDSGFGSEDDIHPSSDFLCNCELCQARIYVSMKQGIDDDIMYCMNHSNIGDGFHIPPPPSVYNPLYNHQNLFNSSFYNPHCLNSQYPLSFLGLGDMHNGNSFGKYMNSIDPGVYCDDKSEQNSLGDNVNFNRSSVNDNDSDLNAYISMCPQVYTSKDGVMHIRLSSYVALELSNTAYRLINYRNNSTIALSDNGEYGYVYHYNCRGLINLYHQKVSIAFDNDRQVLLRNEKPSFIKKDKDYFRLIGNSWTSCRVVSMENFDKDKTPDILKRAGYHKSVDDSRLRDIINSSVMHMEGGNLIIYLGDAKVEQKMNGDVHLSWMKDERVSCMVISPLSGSFSLSTKNLDILITPKTDIYISFLNFFVHTSFYQMSVSNGCVTGKCDSYMKEYSPPCTRVASSTVTFNHTENMFMPPNPCGQPYFCNHSAQPNLNLNSFGGPPNYNYKASRKKNFDWSTQRENKNSDEKDSNDTFDIESKSDSESLKG